MHAIFVYLVVLIDDSGLTFKAITVYWSALGVFIIKIHPSLGNLKTDR